MRLENELVLSACTAFDEWNVIAFENRSITSVTTPLSIWEVFSHGADGVHANYEVDSRSQWRELLHGALSDRGCSESEVG